MATNKAPRRRHKDHQTVTDRVLADVMAFIARFVVMTDAQRLVIALWILHTHLIEHAEQTPYLSITSPDPECGKSRLLEVLELLVARPWLVVRPSEAVSYRQIDSVTPTLLLDEVDTIFNPQSERYHEGLRAILDAGHRRGATVPRAAEFGKRVEHFRTFSAKALAGIGSLPDTISRRSLYIRLERKRKTDQVERFIRRDVAPGAGALREQVAAWAKDHGKAIGRARPDMPQELSDRMQEGCESLVAIADRLGVGGVARTALVELLTGIRLDEHETMRMRLLRDIRDIWQARETERGRRVRGIPTRGLLEALWGIEEAPWHSYYRRGLEANDLANLLRHYGVHPTNIKMRGGKVLKGYRRDDLYPVFTRYLSSGGSGGSA